MQIKRGNNLVVATLTPESDEERAILEEMLDDEEDMRLEKTDGGYELCLL